MFFNNNRRNFNKEQALFEAISNDDIDRVRELIRIPGIDLNYVNPVLGDPLLTHAINDKFRFEIARLLIQAGADVNLGNNEDRFHNNPLNMAIYWSMSVRLITPDFEVIKEEAFKLTEELLEKGADPNQLDSAGIKPLAMAQNLSDSDQEMAARVINLLIQYGAELNQLDENYRQRIQKILRDAFEQKIGR